MSARTPRFSGLLAPKLSALALTLAVGCSDVGSETDATTQPKAPGPTGVLLLDDGVAVRSVATDAPTWRLRPIVRIDGAWHAAASCDDKGRCPIDGLGSVTIERAADAPGTHRDHALRLRWDHDAAAANIDAIGLRGVATLPGASGWLSLGAQSWSQSGPLALGAALSDAAINKALAVQADAEVVRKGDELSWSLGAIGGGAETLVLGALDATALRTWVHVERPAAGADDGERVDVRVDVRIVSGGTPGEARTITKGGSFVGEWLFLGLGAQRPTLAAYAMALPSRRLTQANPPAAEAGWNSWYELWDTVDADAATSNINLAAPPLGQALTDAGAAGKVAGEAAPQAPTLRLVVDDGWQLAWGDWRENAKFPGQPASGGRAERPGLTVLADGQQQQGRTMGLWLAPLLVQEDTPVAKQHPEWLLPNVSYNHLKHGKMRVLDVTHPGAAAWLQQEIANLVGRGITLLKIDFLFAGMLPDTRHDPSLTPTAALDLALATIRKGAGESTLLLAVGAPPLPTLRHVDGWRVGPDIAVENFGPSWVFVANTARTLAARWPYCLATLCDPDPPVLRDLPTNEAEVSAWVASFGGGGFFLSDDLRTLPAERLKAGLADGRVRLGVSGVPAQPDDLFAGTLPTTLANAVLDHLAAKNDHHAPTLWHLQDGRKLGLNVRETAVDVLGVSVAPHSAKVLP